MASSARFYYVVCPHLPSSDVVDIYLPGWVQKLLFDQIVKWPQFLRIHVKHGYLSEKCVLGVNMTARCRTPNAVFPPHNGQHWIAWQVITQIQSTQNRYSVGQINLLYISLLLYESYANVSSQICPFLAARSQFHYNQRVNFSTPRYCQSATFGRLTFCVYP